MTDSKEWCDGDWRCRSSSKPFAGAESGSPGRALEAGKRGSPGRPVQAGIRGKRLNTLDRQTQKSTYKLKRCFFRTDRRIAPKSCTHVRIETKLALT